MVFFMEKPSFPEKQTTSTSSWGTWEELLLACAVHRFGTNTWDSVASELRKRSSNLHLLTPHACKRKFHDLRRRFTQDHAVDDKTPIPWLDQLRQRRLDELRRELQRYDHSIVSLQLKVDKLTEEREQCLSETEKSVEKSDLGKTGEEEIKREDAEPENISPKKIDVSGEASVRDDRSFDESKTTDLKPEIPETGVTDTDKGSEKAEPDEPAGEEIGATEKRSNPAVENSCNGSSDSVVKELPVVESEKGNSGELRESVAESKGGEEDGKKESPSSSEVQSSATLSRKLGHEPKPVGPEEPGEQEDQSPARKRVPIQSQPLVDFLGILRSHKVASFFERRLHSQEAAIYTNMIRQHVDFETVQTRLEAGFYSPCRTSLFFRDLLLICHNASVFFGQKSPEYKAACELRSLVSKEKALQAPPPKQDPPPKEETPTQPAPPPNPEPETSESLLAKSKLSLPLTACRKRSSITARASTSSSGPERKKEQTTKSLLDVKPPINWKQKEESPDEVEELRVNKTRRKERLRSSSRNSSSKNWRSRNNANNDRNSDANANANVGSSSRVVTSNSDSKAETEKKSNDNASGKKRSAADFLSRMKRTSSSNNGSLLETSKTPDGNSKGGISERKKNGNGKGSAQKDEGSRRGSGGRLAAKEQESPMKRSVGRPSKRAAAPPAAGPVKRARRG